MDPLDILTNKDQAFPCFQPIYSADEHIVVGYEVLGRIHDGAIIRSLGSFFHDESVPDEYRLEVDDLILNKALKKLLTEQNENVMLFINRDANLLMNDHGESLRKTLLHYREEGISLNRIVIEVTEHDFIGDIDQLNHLFSYFKTYGIKLAIDNVGKDGSNLDRLRLLNPDILKIDLQMLKQTGEVRTYQDVLFSISMLARKIGAELMYEDIETEFQLQYAWRNGGRYYQGYFLGNPEPTFIDEKMQKQQLKQSFEQFILHEKKKLQVQHEVTSVLEEKVKSVCGKCGTTNYHDLINKIAEALHDESFRIYVCDGNGFQKSENIFKEYDEWKLQPEYYDRNWSWRPYFLQNIMRMSIEQRGILSDLYSDIETGDVIRTFSYPIERGHYIFIDISYNYLFKKDELL
ncbi:EAL domain-containing protein [Bacillus solimangrovi]|uniref:Diguanylate phosphodiesterase n=1 Tax=Bacillus solimangrovi TaxID=1305675 RepID=A0A1E5LJG0_9BACI|nr:EAL-associated domain-containing protein [Bacillus solimangrovi]OEH94227.1 diguanylate phosphodiesterase [Bacillus solimangrovi]